MLGELIGAGTSIISGLLGNKATKDNNAALAQQREKEYQQQKEFAQSGIQWKVSDAEKAGIHPLYALGANTVSYSPQSVGGSSSSNFDFLGNAGQNIGRAIDSTRTPQAKGMARVVTGLQVEGLQLDNEYKKAQIASLNATTPINTPALPGVNTTYQIPGQAGSGVVDTPQINVKKTVSPAMPGNPTVEAAPHPDVAYAQGPRGMTPVIPQQLAESYEQDPWGQFNWMIRNRLNPNFKSGYHTEPGKDYDYWTGEYKQPRSGLNMLNHHMMRRMHRSWRPGKHRIPNAWSR